MLWLALLTRETGIPASERLRVEDEVTALSFDLAVTLRLFRFDNEKDTENKEFWIQMLGGKTDVGGGDNANTYADANTEVW